MTTRADITRQIARLVTRTVIGATTSAPGNGTQVIDTVNLAGFADNSFLLGTVWITSGANIGLTRTVTAFNDTADRLTVAAFPSNIASGVTFEVAPADFVTYQDLVQAANLAMRETGMLEYKDETTSAVENDLLYTLPTGVFNVSRIEVVTDLGTVDEAYQLNTHWEERDGKLYFDEGFEPAADDSQIIRILYEKFAPDLTADADTISTQINEEYLVYLGARQAMRQAYKRFGKAGSDTIPEWLNEAIEEAKKHIKPNQNRTRVRIRTAAN